VANCLQALQSCLRHLPRNEAAVNTVTAAIGHVSQASITALLQDEGLHDFIDELQIEFNQLHAVINASWFEPQT
jgi:uncharacterized alpha-E superfamily protein